MKARLILAHSDIAAGTVGPLAALLLISLGCTLSLGGCGRSTDKPELINKMRPLGVSTSPVIAAPGDKVLLTFHFALPADETLTTETYEPIDTTGLAVPVSGMVITGLQNVTGSACPDQAAHCKFASFDYAAVTAAFTVPQAIMLPIDLGSSRRLRYGIHVASASNATSVENDLLVFAPGSPQLKGAPVQADIAEPAASTISAGDAIELRATMTKYFDETAKIGWFTGCGEVKNRRALATSWSAPAGSSCTLVFTARGVDSRALAIKIKDYTLQ